MKRKEVVVLVVAFDGYHEGEYAEIKKAVEDAGVFTSTASIKKGAAIAKDGSSCAIDCTIDSINPDECLGVCIIGGPGALEDLNSLKMHHIIQKIIASGVVLGAIGTATRILAQAGVLAHKNATGWNGDKKLHEFYGTHDVIYEQKALVIDGKIITARDAECAKEFAKAMVELMSKTK
jgi:putative intracellular protease/amidase